MAEYESNEPDDSKKEEKTEPQSEKVKEFIKASRDGLKTVIDEEDPNRRDMMDDLRFATLDQWPADVRKDRENDLENGPRPCLTIDKISQYIMQVVNDARQGKPGINVRPMDDQSDVETAKILKGIVRNIEDQSNADIAYSTGIDSTAKIGLGYWRVTTEYVDSESFDQELFIRPIPNTFSVYLEKHYMPDGSDAKKAWIIENMPIEVFKKQYPGKKTEATEFEDLGAQKDYWRTGETVTVVEHYCLESQRTTLYFLADGTTITDDNYEKWPESAGAKPTIVDRRTTFKEQLKWAKHTGIEILEEEGIRDLPGKYIPIVEVVGRESHVNGRRILWGLVRPAKDSLRMYNYFASTITEKMGLAPKAPFIGAKGQFAGVEDKWQKANRTNFSYLEYEPIEVNGNVVPRPERQGPTPMEAALLHQMTVIEHDVQTSLGMFKAAVGETESQQSGRAILALQRESDTGTYHFGANQGISIRHTGRIIVDLIPHYYDTKRVVRILGEDGTVQTAQLDPSQEMAHQKVQGPDGLQSIYNPGVGKYDVAITVGPSYNTKRMEAAATLTEVVKSQPQLMPMIGDLLFRSLDFPYSDQIAERLKKMLPPPLQDGKDPAAQLMQAMQKMQQMGQQMQEMHEENVKLKAGVDVKVAGIQASAQADQQAAQQAHERGQFEAQAKHQQSLVDAENAKNIAVFKARLDAAAKIEVAQIAAKGKLTEAAITAENDANIALSQMITDHATAVATTPIEADGNTDVAEPAATPIAKLTQIHAEGQQQSQQAILALGQLFAQSLQQLGQMMIAAQSRPKTVTAKSSSGTTMTATVQ